jgi:hypothetical protein
MSSFDVCKATCHLTRLILEQVGEGEVFGGFVRDMAIKYTAADAFYKKCSEGKCDKKRYSCRKEDPETADDRLIMSKDMDIFFRKEEDVPEFIKRLEEANLTVKCCNIPGVSNHPYLGFDREISVNKLVCSFNMQNAPVFIQRMMLPVRVLLDVVTGPEGVLPPFSVEPDLACNTLMLRNGDFTLMPCMTSHLHWPQKRLEALNKLLGDVRAHRTQLISPLAPVFRIQKLAHNWRIEADNVSSSCEAHLVDDEDCFICLQPFIRKKNSTAHTKQPYIELGCCKKHMHKHCAKTWLAWRDEDAPCPHCGIRDFVVGKKDVRLITAIGDLREQ